MSGMKSFNLMEVMKGISTKMIADFDNITAQIEHKGAKGEGREEIVKRFLKEYLPKSFGIGSGFVIDSTGRSSLQQDIVIYDVAKCPILYDLGSQVFPVEGVYAVIEVKSNLNGEELNDSIEKILSVKKLQKTEFFMPRSEIIETHRIYGKDYQFFPTLGYVFAFDSIELGALTSKLYTQNQQRGLAIENRVDVICVLKRGLVLSYHDKKGITPLPEPDTYLCFSESESSLLLFYLLFMAIITQAKTNPINLIRYVPLPSTQLHIVGKN